MLKPQCNNQDFYDQGQPPSGGCVLKPPRQVAVELVADQPPSGGCVLKPMADHDDGPDALPAAFRRLCVETTLQSAANKAGSPAAFRRLCVETNRGDFI